MSGWSAVVVAARDYRSHWVRVSIIGPDTMTVASRDVEDAWYVLGGHRPSDFRQRARDEMAAVELHEWLRRNEPRTGTYVVLVVEIEYPDGPTVRTWSSMSVSYTSPSEGGT